VAAGDPGNVEVAICPPFVYLEAVAGIVRGSQVGLGAQNVCDRSNGAFTGEISATMLVDVACKYVIIGHSERRQFFGDTDALVLAKTRTALQHGLIPIVCVGESLEQRTAGKTKAVIATQFQGSLGELTDQQMSQVVIAYEPVWAIGTGAVATPQQAEEVHADLRRLVESRYNAQIAAAVRIQYGGSVKPENAAELLRQANIDGALVGGASLKADSFLAIIAGAR
jgi:triosephosphate isomerase